MPRGRIQCSGEASKFCLKSQDQAVFCATCWGWQRTHQCNAVCCLGNIRTQGELVLLLAVAPKVTAKKRKKITHSWWNYHFVYFHQLRKKTLDTSPTSTFTMRHQKTSHDTELTAGHCTHHYMRFSLKIIEFPIGKPEENKGISKTIRI